MSFLFILLAFSSERLISGSLATFDEDQVAAMAKNSGNSIEIRLQRDALKDTLRTGHRIGDSRLGLGRRSCSLIAQSDDSLVAIRTDSLSSAPSSISRHAQQNAAHSAERSASVSRWKARQN